MTFELPILMASWYFELLEGGLKTQKMAKHGLLDSVFLSKTRDPFGKFYYTVSKQPLI